MNITEVVDGKWEGVKASFAQKSKITSAQLVIAENTSTCVVCPLPAGVTRDCSTAPLPQRLQGFFGVQIRLLLGGPGFVLTSQPLISSNKVDVSGDTL